MKKSKGVDNGMYIMAAKSCKVDQIVMLYQITLIIAKVLCNQINSSRVPSKR